VCCNQRNGNYFQVSQTLSKSEVSRLISRRSLTLSSGPWRQTTTALSFQQSARTLAKAAVTNVTAHQTVSGKHVILIVTTMNTLDIVHIYVRRTRDRHEWSVCLTPTSKGKTRECQQQNAEQQIANKLYDLKHLSKKRKSMKD